MAENGSVRDWLARDRTHLANERTVLAYWRTSLAFLVLGAFLIKFFQPGVEVFTMATASIVFGIALLAFGTTHFLEYKKKINDRRPKRD